MAKSLLPTLGIITSLALQAPVSADYSKQDETNVFWQGDEALPETVHPGYNYPAAFLPREGDGSLRISAAYLYWFVGQDGMDLATIASVTGMDGLIPTTGGGVINPSFGYKSAFKAALEWVSCCDQWVWKGEYTWFHNNTYTAATAPSVTPGTGALYLANWFYNTSGSGQGVLANSLTSNWCLDMDLFDFTIERPAYQGIKLTLTPFYGLRAAWIKQRVDVIANNIFNFSPPSEPVEARGRSVNWGVGPRAGVSGDYLLSGQLRVLAKAAANILFTRFTEISHFEDILVPQGSTIEFGIDRNLIRPSAEASIGLGWGTYFWNERLHFDLNILYDVNYFWAQNMIRYMNDLTVIGTGSAASDLYMHGLTVWAGFSF